MQVKCKNCGRSWWRSNDGDSYSAYKEDDGSYKSLTCDKCHDPSERYIFGNGIGEGNQI